MAGFEAVVVEDKSNARDTGPEPPVSASEIFRADSEDKQAPDGSADRLQQTRSETYAVPETLPELPDLELMDVEGADNREALNRLDDYSRKLLSASPRSLHEVYDPDSEAAFAERFLEKLESGQIDNGLRRTASEVATKGAEYKQGMGRVFGADVESGAEKAAGELLQARSALENVEVAENRKPLAIRLADKYLNEPEARESVVEQLKEQGLGDLAEPLERYAGVWDIYGEAVVLSSGFDKALKQGMGTHSRLQIDHARAAVTRDDVDGSVSRSLDLDRAYDERESYARERDALNRDLASYSMFPYSWYWDFSK